MPLVSTRGRFNLDNGKLVGERNPTDYDAFDIPGLQPGTSCPNEAVIYVHGVWTGKGSFLANLENETGVFNRARLSLSTNINLFQLLVLVGTQTSPLHPMDLDGRLRRL
ncbi:MAG: hypothetical protein ACJ71B_03260 [Nitrososphaera sp.]